MPSPPPPPIQVLLLDVDGVLTDGRIRLADDGREIKVFSARDGLGIRLWLASGRQIAFVTGRASAAVEARAAELGVSSVLTGVGDKGAALQELAATFGTPPRQIAAMGDDLPDLAMMRRAGFAIAPADAAADVRAAAHLTTTAPGGAGAVREAIEFLLRAAGAWEEVTAPFTSHAPERSHHGHSGPPFPPISG